ncbi:MAG: hypothetical protein IT245_00630 [Bacteroidia bacterium]|nr:hypothetical protein [Bacteroidia bacterium]
MRAIIFSFLILGSSIESSAQKLDWQVQVDIEQNRIDMMDGDLNSELHIGSERQNHLATSIFFTSVDRIQDQIRKMDVTKSAQFSRGLFEYLKKIDKKQVLHLTSQQRAMEMLEKLVTLNNDTRELELLKTDLKVGLVLSDIINLKPYAKTYWVYAASYYPTDVLNLFKTLVYTPLGNDVVLALARIDPGAIKQYFGTNHLIDRAIKNSKDSIAQLLYSIYNTYSSASKSYALLDLIVRKKWSIEKADKVSKDPVKFYQTLIELRKRKDILADYTVEKELESISLEKVVEINLRHEEKDTVRFEPIQNNSAQEIYTSIVYCQEEVFTSSFLGMYKRMMAKRQEKSGYDFLKSTNFNRFRVFIKQCAGYNKLDDFFSTMNDSQVNAIIKMFAGGLYNYGGDLAPSVDVADTYGSLENEKFKAIFNSTLEKELRNCILNNNEHGIKIYGLLLKLTGGNPESFNTVFNFNIPELDRISSSELFPDSTHIQQHFFFDDEDGETAFASWLNLYPVSLYKKEDKGTYVVFKSIKGRKMEIYANKPSMEIQGRKDLQAYFEKRGRYPDLIVHRGHSYYIDNTLDNMTNSNKVAILGSCGGYQNIAKAMENAYEVQIISTKQVGTLAVNTVLIQEITETIRLGKDLIWPDVWKQIAIKLKNNPQFKDYIPPYKNLGARFITAYNEISI